MPQAVHQRRLTGALRYNLDHTRLDQLPQRALSEHVAYADRSQAAGTKANRVIASPQNQAVQLAEHHQGGETQPVSLLIEAQQLVVFDCNEGLGTALAGLLGGLDPDGLDPGCRRET